MTLPSLFYFLATLIVLPAVFSIVAQVILAHAEPWHVVLVHILIYNPIGFWMSYGFFNYLVAIPFYGLYNAAVLFFGVQSPLYRMVTAMGTSALFFLVVAGMMDQIDALKLTPILLLTLGIASLISYLRVITLSDGQTLHNAFPDRDFQPEKGHQL